MKQMNLYLMSLLCVMMFGSIPYSMSADNGIDSERSLVEKIISGTIVDTDGEPLIGVNILAKDTGNGTISDIDGTYSLSVADDTEVLVFSYTGFQTQELEIGTSTILNVTMTFGSLLDEVVVTSIGLTREKKTLSYSITQIGGDEISMVKDHNPLNSLVGKVSGVVISQGTGGPGGGSRVVIRGNNSITGNNQPLIVVDGMPIDASGSNSGGSVYNSSVSGGGITDINPDDIESISVLKGPNAAALYGSRASNGVLLVTTKKGSAREGIGVSINSSINFDNPMFLPEYQNEYGQGTQGDIPNTVTDLKNSTSSWGPRLDGSSQLYYTGDQRAYSAEPDNVKDFFQTGTRFINSLALEGGSKDFNSRFSYTNNRTESFIPNSDLNSHNFSLRSQMNLSPKLSIDTKATYFNQEINNKVSQGSEGVLAYVYTMPRNVAIADLENYQNIEESLDAVSYSSLGANPYWILNHDSNVNKREKILGFAKATYTFNDFLTAFVRVGTDVTTVRGQGITQAGHHFFKSGRLSASSARNTETNSDFLLMFNKDISSSINLSINAGGNASYRTFEGQRFSAENFKIPTRPILANTVESFPFYTPVGEKKVNSLYGSVVIDYNGWAFLEGSLRNDWSSALAEKNRSYSYPSFGASFLLNRFIDPNSNFFDLLKVRANYAQVGNDTGIYQLDSPYFVAANGYLDRITLSRDNVRKSEDLLPESINSLEFGLEARFLQNRAFVDFSVYSIKSTDLIFDVPVPSATGFSSFRENIGEVSNKGIELLIGGTPVRTSSFSWDLSMNLGKNENKLVELIDDLDSYSLNTTNSGNVTIQGTVGGGYGDIYGTTWRRNDAGDILLSTEGFPQASSDKSLLGNAQPKWIGGLTNTFSFGNLSLRFLIDGRFGGNIYSATNAGLDGSGVSIQSLEHRESGIVVDGVIEMDDGTFVQNTNSITAQQYWGNYSGIAENYIFSQDNIRLREFAIGYALPKTLLSNSPFQGITVSLTGRNLFFLKKNIDHVDPEAILGTGNNGMGILSSNLPTQRSLGVNVSLKF